jgi:hypothetical protein
MKNGLEDGYNPMKSHVAPLFFQKGKHIIGAKREPGFLKRDLWDEIRKG